MKTFSDKLREARRALKLSQQQLADMIGVSARSVIKYEVDGVMPRKAVLSRIADVLKLSIEYLTDNSIGDPNYGLSDKNDEVYEVVNEKAGRELDFLLQRSSALFAGGELSQEAKDEFFEAVTKSYIRCREVARSKKGYKGDQ